MPAIPQSTRDSITWRLILYAEKNWPQLGKVQVTCRGAVACVTAALPGDERQPLLRLRSGGSAHSFGFALYSHASERSEDSVLFAGSPTGTPQKHSTEPARSTSPPPVKIPNPDELTEPRTKCFERIARWLSR